MKGSRFICFLFALYRGSAGATNCGNAEKCVNPVEDFKTLFACRITDVISRNGEDRIIKTVVTELCSGMNTDQIAAHFKSVKTDIKEAVMKGVDLGTMGKILNVLPPFERCMRTYNADVNSVTTALSSAFKKEFSGLISQASTIAAKYKGKCSDPGLIRDLGQFACPEFTHDFVQRFLIAAKTEVGPSFACWKSVLNGKVVNLNQYDI